MADSSAIKIAGTGAGCAHRVGDAGDRDGLAVRRLRWRQGLAHSENDGRRIFRKDRNYVQDIGPTRESGLIFLSHQADVAGQFLPLLARSTRPTP